MEDTFGLVGQVLREQYEIDSVAGHGGFGIVYRGFHLGFDHPIAIKCLRLPPELPEQARPVFLESFREEGKVLYKLSQHPAVVRVLETGVAEIRGEPVPYLVMEWLDGHDLRRELLTRLKTHGAPFTPREAVDLLRPAMEGVASAHKLGYAHRDIKPANLFVCDTPLGRTTKVLDFGVAKLMQEGDTAAAAFTRGDAALRPFSPSYGAPEQVSVKDYGATGPWTDVHALALCLVELVSGKRALQGSQLAQWMLSAVNEERPTPRARGANVSDAFEAELARALSLRSEDRHPDAEAFLRGLDAALAASNAAWSEALARDEPTDTIPSHPDSIPDAAAPEPPSAKTAPLPEGYTHETSSPIERTQALPEGFRPMAQGSAPPEPIVPTTRAGHADAGDLHDLVGQEVSGFRLTHFLGEGGMALVYRGENVVNPNIVRAIKIVRPELFARGELGERFAKEALTLERLNHENIVRFYGFRTHAQPQRRLLVMELELLEGRTLRATLGEARGELSLADVVRWMTMAARGVAAAHTDSVVHRDLKLENLFLTNAGTLKVLDFGLAKALDDADRAQKITRDGALPGSPDIMAPEVCGGQLPSARSDVYALGIVLMELVLGHHPFATSPSKSAARPAPTDMMLAHVKGALPSLRERRADVPRSLARIAERATRREPADRFADAGELADALEAIEGELPASPPPRVDVSAKLTIGALPDDRERAPTAVAAPSSSMRTASIAAVAGALVIAGIGAWWALRDSPREPASDETPLEERTTEVTDPTIPEERPTPIENEWVRVNPPFRPVQLGLAAGAADTAKGLRAARGVDAPSVPFEIQQHEVTWSELEAYLSDHPETPVERPAWVPTEAASRARWAATYVPWTVARAYCRSAGADLPTEEQWEYAARREPRRAAPWGSGPIDYARTRVFGGADGHAGEVMAHDQDRTVGPADYAVWDLAGNALEWTLDVYRDDLPGQDESWTQADGMSFRAVRGLPPFGSAPSPLQPEITAYRDALCATGSCPEGTARILQHVGFRCARAVSGS